MCQAKYLEIEYLYFDFVANTESIIVADPWIESQPNVRILGELKVDNYLTSEVLWRSDLLSNGKEFAC